MPSLKAPSKIVLKSLVKQTLKEDIGKGDITTNSLIPKNQKIKAGIFSREAAVVCGVEVVKQVFKELDGRAKFKTYHQDASRVKANQAIIEIYANARAILSGERVALNFLSHLSGIATATAKFVSLTKHSKAKILDTRKTLPGMRTLEKYAVKCGGGVNHRLGLWDMVLIKDNHKEILGKNLKLDELINKAKFKNKNKKIEIEVEDLKEFREALKASPDIIMLDNMALAQIKKAVKLLAAIKKGFRPKVEVSGNVSLEKIRQFAKAGVDFISVGSLTHSVKAIDMSLEIV